MDHETERDLYRNINRLIALLDATRNEMRLAVRNGIKFPDSMRKQWEAIEAEMKYWEARRGS